MAEADKLNIDSIIARLLEGKFLKVNFDVVKSQWRLQNAEKTPIFRCYCYSSWSAARQKCEPDRK